MSRLLDEALELDEAGRGRWLTQLDPGDQDLLPALCRALLPSNGPADQSLGVLPAIGAIDPAIASGLGPGAHVGPYLLERLLGAGGMAEVWLARRADGAYKREVALKLPMLSRLRRDLAQRFAHERDILAGLEHPNIARLYDAGVCEDGLPYLAMEFVPGEPITTWCDRHLLGVRERIKLFLQVLDAVQYAHARQVIHRDVKPSNILVTESGQVRLLDFGVAKLLEDGADQTQLTQLYGRALTPDYASPEHIQGEAGSAASDIYSLGVVIYELLSGSRPYRLKHGASPAMLEMAITEARVQRPSSQISAAAGKARATTQDKLSRRLRGDLEAIVLKALARRPQDRYASASALADDLERYLRAETVEARPAGLLYQSGKFTVRHRAGIAWGALAAAAVVATALLVQSRSPASPSVVSISVPNAPEFAPPEKSIAVLPFVNMTDDPKQEFFADGLAEELLDLLSRVPELHVAARTSAFSFKGKKDDIPTIARKLLVANVLEGSVRKSGDNIRITVQLVRADNGYHLWSQTYERKLRDIFKIQDEIADSVVRSLKVSLLQSAMPKATGTKGTEAYTLFLRARALQEQAGSPEDEKQVGELTKKALELDPSYAPAWSLLAAALDTNPNTMTSKDWDEARQAAQKALALDPKLAGAHCALARILLLHDWDWAAGQAQVQQALALDPGNALALAWAGDLEITMGRLEKGLEILRTSVANDPLNPHRYEDLYDALLYAERYDEAIAASRDQLALNPHSQDAHTQIGTVLLIQGNPAASLAEFESDPDEEIRLAGRALANFALRRKSDADSALANLVKNHSDHNSYLIAEIYAFRGQSDPAFLWLGRAYRVRDENLVFSLRYDPLLKSLRADPRFREILEKMHLPA